MTVRGRSFLGSRELLDDPTWSGELHWLDRNSLKRSGHRPDLVGVLDTSRIAIEVELAAKSKRGLDAILKLHHGWLISHKTNGVIYICGDEEGCRRIERAGNRIGFYPTDRHLRIETLETIKAQTAIAFEQSRRPDEQAAA